MKKIALSTIIALTLVLSFYFYQDKILGSASGVNTQSCTTTTVSPVQVKTTASTILATSSARAYAKIELIKTAGNIATSTPSISFLNGAKATVATGLQLSTTTPSIEFGLDTDFPYTGQVSGIVGAGSSTIVRVTQCVY